MLHAGYQQNLVFQHERFDNMKVMIDSLEQLDRVSIAIFEAIERRIKKSHERLETIEKRIDQVREKVKMVQQRKKATTVYSTPNFPTQSNQTENSSLLLHCTPVTPRFHKVDIYVTSKIPNPVFENPLTAESFIVVGQDQKLQTKRQESLQDKEGLGVFPFKTIRSVCGLLVFNSQENCFFNYNTRFDPLEGVDFDEEKKESEGNARAGEDDGTGLFPAPKSITLEANSTTFIDLQPESSVSFAPKMGEVPKFSLPTSLPDLPNINDLPWQLDAKVDQSIAPSSLMLPSVEDNITSIFPTTNTSTTQNMSMDQQAQMQMQMQMQMMNNQQNMMMPQSSSMMMPPPPPPPPPMMGNKASMKLPVSQSPDADGDQQQNEDGGDDDKGGNGGGDFLAEIRNFNKNKLKRKELADAAAKKEASEPKKAAAAPAAPSGTDFMSQLFNKISLRRKAIEGKKKPAGKGGNEETEEEEEEDSDVEKFDDKKEEQQAPPPQPQKKQQKEQQKEEETEKKQPEPQKKEDDEDWSVNDSESEEEDF